MTRSDLRDPGWTVVRAAWIGLALLALFSIAFHRAPGSGWLDDVLALAFPLLLLVLLRAFQPLLSAGASQLADWLETREARRWLASWLLIGMAARLAFGLAYPFDPYSDMAAYWELAQRLAAGETYAIGESRSYWPPGLPLLLSLPVLLLGAQDWVPLAVNVALFAATALAVHRLADHLAGGAAAGLAIVIVALWPNLILHAANPHKELLVAMLLPVATLLYLRAASCPAGARLRLPSLAGSGLCLGLLALTQPATLLIGLILLGYELFEGGLRRRAIARLAITALVAIMTVLPWTLRNHAVHGAFVPVNTAGGTNLYSANNPAASGAWIPKEAYLDKDFAGLNEVEINRLGYRKGLAWIADNTPAFMRLAALKSTRLFAMDSGGAFFVFQHPEALRNRDPALGDVLTRIANGYWLLLWLAILAAGLRLGPHGRMSRSASGLFLLSVVYFLAIHAVFQAQGKHHLNFAASLAVMAGAVLVRPRAAGFRFDSHEVNHDNDLRDLDAK